MASKTVVTLEDDLSGGKAEETVVFELDGVSYEIDLNAKNATKLRKVFEQYVAAGRRIGGRRRVGRVGAGPKPDREQSAGIRTWARSQGYDVGDRGRIPVHVVEAYNAGS